MLQPTYTVYDIETTGLSAACQCEIIEFAGIRLDSDFNEIDRMHVYIKPYKKLPKKIIELTGITNEQLAGCENRYKVLPAIRRFIGDTISVCHNAQFDVGFISTMCLQQGLPLLTEYICTMKTFKAVTGEKTAKLAYACEHYGIELKNAHTAIADVEATVKLLKAMVKESGITKFYTKRSDEYTMFVDIMRNIAAQNPNKKIRDILCSQTNNTASAHVTKVLDGFFAKQNPTDIINQLKCKDDEVADLFLLWLNESRLPRYIFLEDLSLNRQVKNMIEKSESLDFLYELHKEIYKTDSINKSIYHYFWLKYNKKPDLEIVKSVVYRCLNEKLPLAFIFTHLSVDANTLVHCFIDFAFKHKQDNNYRSFIADQLCNKKDLIDGMNISFEKIDKKNMVQNELLLKQFITYELYQKGFFKVSIGE